MGNKPPNPIKIVTDPAGAVDDVVDAGKTVVDAGKGVVDFLTDPTSNKLDYSKERTQPTTVTGAATSSADASAADQKLRAWGVSVADVVRFAPQVRLARGEPYGPCSVPWFLEQVDVFMDGGEGNMYPKKALRTNRDTSPPLFRGQIDNLAAVPVYAFVVPLQGTKQVRFVYWFFYAYNLGKGMFGFPTVGNHVADWEHISVVVDASPGAGQVQPVYVYYAAHNFGTPIPWANVPKTAETHPIAYSAYGSHGSYVSAGDHTYVNLAGGTVKLSDHTDDGGPQWNTWTNVDVIPYQTEPYTGAHVWMNYKGRWGTSSSGCARVKKITGECVLNDGPLGLPIKRANDPSVLSGE